MACCRRWRNCGSVLRLSAIDGRASAGFDVARHLQVTVEAGRMQDVLSSFTEADWKQLDQETSAFASAVAGVPITLTTRQRMPTNYVTGGVRVPFGYLGHARPYATAAAGIAHMSPAPTFTAAVLGERVDVTSDIFAVPEAQKLFREDTRNSFCAVSFGRADARLSGDS